jgi:hypothetical protein
MEHLEKFSIDSIALQPPWPMAVAVGWPMAVAVGYGGW